MNTNIILSNSVLKNQQGVGLIEVLIALLLLAVAVMGFSALQMRSIQTTDESMKRTQAMSVIRGLAEDIRANSTAADKYGRVLAPNAGASKGYVSTEITSRAETGCDSVGDRCDSVDIASRDSKKAYEKAESLEIELAVAICPGTEDNAERQCIIAAWGDTRARLSNAGAGGPSDCADGNGIYHPQSTCLIVPAY